MYIYIHKASGPLFLAIDIDLQCIAIQGVFIHKKCVVSML